MRLEYDNDLGFCDYVVASNGYELDTSKTLRSALLSMLLSDRQAGPNEELPGGATDRRGWVGDDVTPDGYVIGSKAWLFYNGKITPTTRRRVANALEFASAPFVEKGVASRVAVTVIRLPYPKSGFGMTINVYKPSAPNHLLDSFWIEVPGISGGP